MKASTRAIAAAAVVGATALATGPAEAYCRTTTVRTPSDFTGACWTEGAPLYYPTHIVPFSLLVRDSAVIPNAVLSAKLAAAFAAWTATNPTCAPGLAAVEVAPVAGERIASFIPGERGHNVIGVPTAFPYSSVGETLLAVPTMTYDPESGEIWDVDIEINGSHPWSFDDQPTDETYDLQSALTHVLGHMIGLAHSKVPGATMEAKYQLGALGLRSLEADDQAAVCAVYPSAGERATASGLVGTTPCELRPGDPAGGCPSVPEASGCGCGPAPGAPVSPDRAALLVAACLVGAAARARRRR